MSKSIQTFIKEAGITAIVQRIMSRDDIDASDWARDARHWSITLIRGNRKMQVNFSQGSAHDKPPTVEDVLDCLAMDAQSIDEDPTSRAFKARKFEAWASDLGYDPDSRKAEKTYSACLKDARELKNLLAAPGGSGFGKYNELLYEVERL